MLGAIKTTQLSWCLNWSSPPEKNRVSKAGHQRTTSRTTTYCSSPKSVPDVLTPRCTLILPSSCFPVKIFYCPTPPADKYLYFPFSLCNSIAPPFLLKGTSPFACAFKPWVWLIHWNLDVTQNVSLFFTQGSRLSLPPNLVLRRRSPRDPRITGPAGQVSLDPKGK